MKDTIINPYEIELKKSLIRIDLEDSDILIKELQCKDSLLKVFSHIGSDLTPAKEGVFHCAFDRALYNAIETVMDARPGKVETGRGIFFNVLCKSLVEDICARRIYAEKDGKKENYPGISFKLAEWIAKHASWDISLTTRPYAEVIMLEPANYYQLIGACLKTREIKEIATYLSIQAIKQA